MTVGLLATAALFLACSGNDGSPANGDVATDEASDEVALELVAADTRFDRETLEAPAGSEVALTLDNRDSVEHNFSLYEQAGAPEPLFEGPLLPGPAFLVYQFTAPEAPGTYEFRCDVHPDVMNGRFSVGAASPPGS